MHFCLLIDANLRRVLFNAHHTFMMYPYNGSESLLKGISSLHIRLENIVLFGIVCSRGYATAFIAVISCLELLLKALLGKHLVKWSAIQKNMVKD